MSICFLYGGINCIHAKRQFEANDIKYRFLKANGNSPLLKLLYQPDSLFNLNDDIFVKQVIDKEQIGLSKKNSLGLPVKGKKVTTLTRSKE